MLFLGRHGAGLECGKRDSEKAGHQIQVLREFFKEFIGRISLGYIWKSYFFLSFLYNKEKGSTPPPPTPLPTTTLTAIECLANMRPVSWTINTNGFIEGLFTRTILRILSAPSLHPLPGLSLLSLPSCHLLMGFSVFFFLRVAPFIYSFIYYLFWLCWVFVAVRRLLIAVASLVAEHGL